MSFTNRLGMQFNKRECNAFGVDVNVAMPDLRLLLHQHRIEPDGVAAVDVAFGFHR